MRKLLLASACLLTACGGSTAVEPLAPPASLLHPCPAPVLLPDRALTDQDIEIFWGRDRTALRTCASRHAGLATMMETPQ